MRRLSLITAAFLLALGLAASPVLAQDGDRGDRSDRGERGDRGSWRGGPPGEGFRGGPPGSEGGWRGGPPGMGGPPGSEGGWSGRGGWSRGGFDPTEMVRRMDRNSDGNISPDELDERGRRMLERMTEGTGLDLSQTVSLATVQERMRQRMESYNRGPSDGSSSSSSQPAAPSSQTPATPATPAAPAAPLVPGFGNGAPGVAVPGFGATAVAAASGSSGNTDDRRRDEGRREEGRREEGRRDEGRGGEDRSRQFAQSMLSQYDENKNGTLEQNEWSRMRGDPKSMDANGDNVLTLDEIAAKLASFNRGGPGGGPPSSGSGGSSGGSRTDSKTAGNKNPLRFLTPTERLPKGLPSWFARADVDGDGQVMMHEFSATWSDSKVAEFISYDLNGDGIVPAEEALAAERAKKSGKSTPSTSMASSASSGDRSRDYGGDEYGEFNDAGPSGGDEGGSRRFGRGGSSGEGGFGGRSFGSPGGSEGRGFGPPGGGRGFGGPRGG